MKKFFSSAFVLAFATVFVSTHVQAAESLAQAETRLAGAFKKSPTAVNLEALANTREKAGLHSKAEASWGLMVSLYGAHQSRYSDGAKVMTYAQLAAWMRRRIARKRNLAKNGTATNQQYRRAWYAQGKYLDDPPVEHLSASRTIDFDGDRIEEVIYYGRSGPLGEGVENSMSVARFDGISMFRPVWSNEGRHPKDVTYFDGDKDDFGTATLVFSDKAGDSTTLMFNGSSFIMFSPNGWVTKD